MVRHVSERNTPRALEQLFTHTIAAAAEAALTGLVVRREVEF